jgi:hypothetical protein
LFAKEDEEDVDVFLDEDDGRLLTFEFGSLFFGVNLSETRLRPLSLFRAVLGVLLIGVVSVV